MSDGFGVGPEATRGGDEQGRAVAGVLRGAGDGIRAALEPTDWGRLYGTWRPGLDESASPLKPHETPCARFLADGGTMVHSRMGGAEETRPTDVRILLRDGELRLP